MRAIVGFIFFAVVLGFIFAQAVTSGWDDPAAGPAGWEKFTGNTTLEYQSTGGNPGGYIKTSGAYATGIMNKQPAYTGDYLSKNYNKISVDIMVLMQQLPAFKPAVQLRYSPSFAGWIYKLNSFTIENAGTWRHFDVYFNPEWTDADAQANGWQVTEGPAKSFKDTCAHVWAVSIMGDYPQISSRVLGYDNFILTHEEPPSGTNTDNDNNPPLKPLKKITPRPKIRPRK
jgi:hypothetical protein